MPVKMNPYAADYTDVSNSRSIVERSPICSCCQVQWYWKDRASRFPGDPSPCPDCVGHDLDDPELELEARREHETRLLNLLVRARDSARTAHQETKDVRTRLEAEVHERARATAAALNSREKYMEILAAIEQEHWVDMRTGDGQCQCGMNGCTVTTTIEETREKQRERDFDQRRPYEPGDIRELLRLADERAAEHWVGQPKPRSTVDTAVPPSSTGVA